MQDKSESNRLLSAEKKWQMYWAKNELDVLGDDCTDHDVRYILPQFPYPSGEGLHMGHLRVYTISDALVRFYRMQGKKILHPMGADAFGLPAENAAMKRGIDPDIWTSNNIERFKKELYSMGLSYDWKRYVNTSKPDYYGFTQYIFQLCYEKGLAYRKKAPVNWCPNCQTVLANEQVHQGICWLCDTKVVTKELEQWFLRITSYAQRLLDDLDELDWPLHIKTMQRNWIGRSEGTEVSFAFDDDSLTIFTTRLDTLPGVTYVAIAPDHPLVDQLMQKMDDADQKAILFLKQKHYANDDDKMLGHYTGKMVVNPLNGEQVPLWIANYVLSSYGTGSVMGVPGHDETDFSFAKKHQLPIRYVIQGDEPVKKDQPYLGIGKIADGYEQAGLSNQEASAFFLECLQKRNLAKQKVCYRLRDWLISRQRYWGTPIPIVYCAKCGILPAKLPVILPTDIDFSSKQNPMLTSTKFAQTSCPNCHEQAYRELDTMDTFIDSSWYFFRYIDPHNTEKPFDPAKAAAFLPVDIYIGGVEHAILHLLYARFLTKVLYDMEQSPVKEPFSRLLPQGMVLQDGAKMSKSKGNVVSPQSIIEQYGADTARLFILFAAPPEKDIEWNNEGVRGCYRFLNRLENLYQHDKLALYTEDNNDNDKVEEGVQQQLYYQLHQTIKRVTKDLDGRWHCNTAISAIMELTNALQKSIDKVSQKTAITTLNHLARLIAPFAPHLAETLWQDYLGHKQSVHISPWPKWDEHILHKEEIMFVIQVNGKVRSKLTLPHDATKEAVFETAKPQLANWLKDKKVVKLVFIPARLLNIVVI